MALILIAEDNPDVRLLNVMILRRAGSHRIIEVDNGADALRMAREQQPDLILTDHLMPRMTGQELCRELQADPSTAGIPVIMISASLDAEQGAAGAGVVTFLPKPAHPREVIEAVNAALSGDAVPKPRVDTEAIERVDDPTSARSAGR